MARSKNNLLESLAPFLILGVSVAILIALIVFLSYVFFWGLVIGGVLWVAAFIKERFFPSQSKQKSSQESPGRIIEHDDIK